MAEAGVPVRNYIALAIPFFLLFMGAELLVARARRVRAYRLQDALADLGCGVGQQIVLVFVGAGMLAGYGWLYERFRVVTFGAASPIPWVVAFVVVDFVYYWWHRLSHEVNLLWAAHAVHHQSEDYNLAVALRQSIVTSFTSLPFYYPMALLGVPTTVYATMVAASTLYQFWIHTELVRKLGWLELVLNTPSHHRVHHAVNPQYLDKNYAAILIVWDRLFGTFVEEREPPVFGTTKPIGSFNSAWAQIQTWFEIAEKARALPTRRERARLWLSSPSWQPDGTAIASADPLRTRRKFEIAVPASLQAYAAIHFVPVIAATFLMLLRQYTAPVGPLAVAGVLVAWTLASLGGLMDGQRWAIPVELARLAVIAGTAIAVRPLGTDPVPAALLALPVAAASAWWLMRATRRARPSAVKPVAAAAPDGG